VKLFSKDETFFNHFKQQAVHIGRSAELLKQLFDNPKDANRIAGEIKKVEHDGDAIVHLINQRIDTSFVTPLDREDIHLLAKRLDNVIDLINGAARRVVMFRVTESRPGGAEMADILVRCSREILESVGDVTKRAAMLEHGRAIKALEEEGDLRYAECVGVLFSSDVSPIEVIKWKEIYDALEHAIDECEDVSNVLESIALKNS
jgi:predicted phosphate transport protein (TIGR00153 family)